jgi:hypothetical protein
MARFYIKVGLFGLAVMFCIFFGVSLANRGMERIQGPLPIEPAKAVAPRTKIQAVATPAAKPPVQQKQQQIAAAAVVPLPIENDTSMNRVGNKVGDLLQIVAHHGIKMFVSLFDSVFGR